MKYITTAQAAEKWNLSQRRVSLLCSQGRIANCMKYGKTWLIPQNCEKPDDARRISAGTDALEWDDVCVAEPSVQYNSDYVLRLDPNVVSKAEKYFQERGKSLSDAVTDYLMEIADKAHEKRIGVAKGKLHYCDDIDFCNKEVEGIFGV